MTFGFDINRVPTGSSPKVDIQPTGTQRAERTEKPVTDNKVIGEYGDKLLEQVQPRFVQTAKIPESDAVELNEMFAMAGITKPKMPTVAQYASVAGHVSQAAEAIDQLTVTNNVENLFNSNNFKTLNQFFDIT